MPTCKDCGFEAKNEAGLGRHVTVHKTQEAPEEAPEVTDTPTDIPPEAPESPETGAEPEKVSDDQKALLERIEELEKRDQENQEKLKMLYEVADKGRVFSWESKKNQKGHSQRIKLSVLDDKPVVGWRTVRDELITDPRTGATVGELQQYELTLLEPNGTHTIKSISGYKNFSDIRYENRIDCQVISKSEAYDGTMKFTVKLPDGRDVELDSRFIN